MIVLEFAFRLQELTPRLYGKERSDCKIDYSRVDDLPEDYNMLKDFAEVGTRTVTKPDDGERRTPWNVGKPAMAPVGEKGRYIRVTVRNIDEPELPQHVTYSSVLYIYIYILVHIQKITKSEDAVPPKSVPSGRR